MTLTDPGIRRRHILTAGAVLLAGCASQNPGDDPGETPTPTATDAVTATETPSPEIDGWSVQIAYDGDWQGSVSVTTAEGDVHQAFDDQGTKVVDVETQLGVTTHDVQEIVVTAQKMTNDNQPLRVTIRNDGDVVADGSTDEPQGQVMVSRHGHSNGETKTATDSDTPTSTDSPSPDSGGWSVRFAYDGDWQGSVSVTTAEVDLHQAFDDEGSKIVDIETQLGVATEDVEEIVVTAQKMTNDNQALRVTIRNDGDVVADGSTDAPRGQVMVSYHPS